MNRWYAGLIALLICGCGSNSDSDVAEELDGGSAAADVHHSPLGEDLEAMRLSPLFHEFDVDLFGSDPIQRVANLNISSADTYKISLQTLDLLTEEKRFPLIQADKIIQNGLPKVIAPIGYTVRLEIAGNQIVAVIKSTTGPEMSVQPVPVHTGNNDIIVGDLSSLNLLLSGLQHELSAYTVGGVGVTYSATAFNRYMRYNTSDQWCVQLAKRRVGVDTTMSFQVGKELKVFDQGTLHLSVQNLYGVRECKHINVASLKYSTSNESGIQGHIMASTTLSIDPLSAVGAGCSWCPLMSSRMALGVVVSKLDWNASLDFVLEF